MKLRDLIESINFWRYWNTFSIDQNRLNIKKKHICDDCVKYDWFYERIKIDWINQWCNVCFENKINWFRCIMIYFDRIIETLQCFKLIKFCIWFSCCFWINESFFEFVEIISWFWYDVEDIWNWWNWCDDFVAFRDLMFQRILDESFDDDQRFNVFEWFIKCEKFMQIWFNFFESIKFCVIRFKIDD